MARTIGLLVRCVAMPDPVNETPKQTVETAQEEAAAETPKQKRNKK